MTTQAELTRPSHDFIDLASTPADKINHVWSLNRKRRHLNSSQAAIAEEKRARLDEVYSSELAQMKADAADRKKRKPKSVPQQIGEQNYHEQETGTKRARTAGTNRQYIADARKILDEHPDKAAEIESGEKTIPQVKKELRKLQQVDHDRRRHFEQTQKDLR